TRIQIISEDRYAFDAGSHGHLWSYLQQSRKSGSSLEMSVIIGAPPIHYLTAAAFMDDEYRKIGRIFSFDYVKGFRNDVPVPSASEIVIEARYIPNEEYDEGPFAEYTGYMGYDSTRSVAEVRSLIMRRNPIYVDIMPSNSYEHVNLFSFTRSVGVNRIIRETSPKGHDIRIVWPNYGSRFLALGYVDPPFPGLAKNTALSAIANDPLWNKVVMVNEGKTDLTLERMLLNLAETKNFNRSLTIIRDLYTISSDPTARDDGTDSKLIAITRGSGNHFDVERLPEGVRMTSRNGKVMISHQESDADVNILVPRTIKASDMDRVGWMLALNIDCDRDLRVEDDRIIVDLRKDLHETPIIPQNVISKVSGIARKYAREH
ncbi:MAG: UbiD family decarboxylase, partial [Thermoplasma acidophilum]|nr:UbiD family decarboxylase [Thermoplasma acidophilum]